MKITYLHNRNIQNCSDVEQYPIHSSVPALHFLLVVVCIVWRFDSFYIDGTCLHLVLLQISFWERDDLEVLDGTHCILVVDVVCAWLLQLVLLPMPLVDKGACHRLVSAFCAAGVMLVLLCSSSNADGWV